MKTWQFLCKKLTPEIEMALRILDIKTRNRSILSIEEKMDLVKKFLEEFGRWPVANDKRSRRVYSYIKTLRKSNLSDAMKKEFCDLEKKYMLINKTSNQERIDFIKSYCENNNCWTANKEELEDGIKMQNYISALKRAKLSDEQEKEFRDLKKRYMQRTTLSTQGKLDFLKTYCIKNNSWPNVKIEDDCIIMAKNYICALKKSDLTSEQKNEYNNLVETYAKRKKFIT